MGRSDRPGRRAAARSCRAASASARRWRGRSILSPEIILADEPTGNVDWDMALRLLTLLVELNRMGKTVLIATHDPNLIRAAKARVAGAGAAARRWPGPIRRSDL